MAFLGGSSLTSPLEPHSDYFFLLDIYVIRSSPRDTTIAVISRAAMMGPTIDVLISAIKYNKEKKCKKQYGK